MKGFLLFGFSVSLLFFGIIWFIVAIPFWIKSRKLARLLKEVNFERWKYVTTFWFVKGGGYNSLRWYRYIKSSDDSNNLQISKYKTDLRVGYTYFFTTLLAIILNFVILICVSFYSTEEKGDKGTLFINQFIGQWKK